MEYTYPQIFKIFFQKIFMKKIRNFEKIFFRIFFRVGAHLEGLEIPYKNM